MNFKMTPTERKWVWYDVGNSAFTLLVSTLMSIYFNELATNAGISSENYLAYWGYATSVSTAVVAVLGPTLGTLSDLRGARKVIFSAALLAGAIGCVVLGFLQHWMWFLVLFVIAKSGYSLSLVVYDSMLCDVTSDERMDEVSSRGYAWGYIGSCLPFVLSIGVYILYAMFDLISMPLSMILVFSLTAVWWVGCSVPLLRSYRQSHYVEHGGHPVRTGLKNLGGVFKEVGKNKQILFFLLAFFFFIDGVYTIIDMATAYGTSLGLNTVSLVIALLVTQIVAFPAAILLGMLSRKVKPQYLIIACIVAYFFITVYAIFLRKEYQFWILAVCVGLFQGTIQAMSRSYYAKIVPKAKSGEYFGIYDIFGKGAAFMGTLLVSGVTQIFNNQSIGVGALSVMFLIGLGFFLAAVRAGNKSALVAAEGRDGASSAESEQVGSDGRGQAFAGKEALSAQDLTAEENGHEEGLARNSLPLSDKE